MLINNRLRWLVPTRKNASWQSKIEDGYDEARFNIDWSTETVTCPEGKALKELELESEAGP